MIRPWEKFGVVAGQVEIEYVQVIRRSRVVLVAEVGTSQKYCEVGGFSGAELFVCPSERTRKDSYDPDKPVTMLVFPRSMYGASVAAMPGRYSFMVVLYKPARPPWWSRWLWDQSKPLSEEDWRAMRVGA